MYEYQARLILVVDADTVRLDLDLGFYMTRFDQPYRLLRINAPETNTAAGKASKAALEGFFKDKILLAHTQKSDSFGRFLAEVYADGANVSDWLVANNHAVYQTYK